MAKPDNDTLLSAALTLATAAGYTHVTREAVAVAANVSPALISVRFGTMPQFRRALMRYAVRVECLAVIAQGLALNDPHALKAPAQVRMSAAVRIA